MNVTLIHMVRRSRESYFKVLKLLNFLKCYQFFIKSIEMKVSESSTSFLTFDLVHPFVWVCPPARWQVESYLRMAGNLQYLWHFPSHVSELQLKRCNKKHCGQFLHYRLKNETSYPCLCLPFPLTGTWAWQPPKHGQNAARWWSHKMGPRPQMTVLSRASPTSLNSSPLGCHVKINFCLVQGPVFVILFLSGA